MSVTTNKYDVRSRGWFLVGKAVFDALQSGDTTSYPMNASWTEPYNYFTLEGSGTAAVGVTAVTPFWDSSGLRGVFGVDLKLEEISAGLKSSGVDTSGTGRTWILETGDARMIGTSTDDAISTSSLAYHYVDATIKSQSQSIAGWFDYDWPTAQGYKQDRSDPVIRIVPVGADVGLVWTQVVTASYDYFYKNSDYQIQLSYVLIMLAFAVVSFIIYRLVERMREDREWDLRIRLFNAYNDPATPVKPIQEELAKLKTVQDEAQSIVAQKTDAQFEQATTTKAGEIMYLTMRILKARFAKTYSSSRVRAREAIKYLANAQGSVGEHVGIQQMVMIDHYSPKHDSDFELPPCECNESVCECESRKAVEEAMEANKVKGACTCCGSFACMSVGMRSL